MAEHIKARLGQLDWEITFPEHLLDKDGSIDVALKKLHIWRRLVPLYREMLTETIQRVFRFPCHAMDPASSNSDSSSTSNSGSNGRTSVNDHDRCHCAIRQLASIQEGPISAYRADFTRALSFMEDYQQRIDRVTAAITIDDSRRGLNENRNLARLTWLATFFIPLSFVASLLSMTDDISKLRETIQWYLAVALPLAAISLGLGSTLTLPSVQIWFNEKFVRRTKKFLGISRGKRNG